MIGGKRVKRLGTIAILVLLAAFGLLSLAQSKGADFWLYSWSKGDWHFYANKNDGLRTHRIHRAVPVVSKRITSTPMVTKLEGNSQWLYFQSTYGFGRVRYDGRDEELLKNVRAFSFDVQEDAIYFLDRYTRALYRANLEGEHVKLLIPGECWDVHVEETYVYFSTDGVKNGMLPGIYRIRPDGTELIWLLPMHDFVVYKDSIYYIDKTQDHSVWVYSLTSGETVKIADSESSMDLIAKDDAIYFTNSFSSCVIHVYPTDLRTKIVR